MLVRLWEELKSGSELTVDKYVNGENASLCGAFSAFADIEFCIKNRRIYGICAATLVLWRDGEEETRYPFEIRDDGEFYANAERLSEGLYWYRIEFFRGSETLYSSSTDNVHFSLLHKIGRNFRLLIYENAFKTPDWFKGGVMYHIFVDRFYKSGQSEIRKDAQMENDWYAPVSQYAKRQGDDLKNDLFYGGDLWGITEKLNYLRDMGVTVLYLSPVFKAASNHKYDTGDYGEVDPAFGGNEALEALIAKAAKYGIRVILDGVFNHTGDDSLYFNKYGSYPSKGAYKNPDSPYRMWYSFGADDDDYECWWGIKIHPRLNHSNEECRRFFTGRDGVCASYVKKGTGGWRIDVADELPDIFLDEMRKSVKAADSDAIIIGEVWENAADKIAYGSRRRYLRGRQLDSVMNYPFRNGVLEFVKNKDGEFLATTLTELYSSYPKCVCDCLMNILGTHDTERILTALGDKSYTQLDNASLCVHKMSDAERERGIRLLKIAAAVQYTVYGVPSVFYGDEAGLEGGHDPFCRAAYPWGRENVGLIGWYRQLGEIRKSPVYKDGSFRVLSAGRGYIVFERKSDGERIVTAANVGECAVSCGEEGTDLLSGCKFPGTLGGESVAIIRTK